MDKKYSVLLVDDEFDLLDILSSRFLMAGYKVFTAKNGQEALKILDHDAIDVVITDVQMPLANGVELLEKIRAKDPNTPTVIFITGYSAITLEHAFDKGVQAVFTKPFDFKDLLSCVKNFLSTQEQRLKSRIQRENVDSNFSMSFENIEHAQEAKLLNIGTGGFFMALSVPNLPAIDTEISFHIKFNHGLSEIKGLGQVRWVRKEIDDGLPIGCGVEFLEFEDRSYAHVIQLINSIRTGKYIPRG